MKKNLPAIIAAIGGLFIIAFLAWAFSQHGTIGLYRVNGFFAWIFNIFGILGIILLVLALFLWWRKSSGREGFRWISIIAVILSIPAIIIALAAFILLGGVASGTIDDMPPRLMMTDTTGKYGVPDVALVVSLAPGTNRILSWESSEKIPEPVGEPGPTGKSVFMLRDLEPDTTYTYQSNNGAVVSFTTPPLDGTLHFAVGSDTHYGAQTARTDLAAEMLEDIAAPANGFDAFFFLGDMVEYGFLNGQWQEAFQAFSPVTSSIPSAFAPGNHDTLFSGFGNYLDYCYPEAIDMQSGSRLWYRLDIGDVHILVLDIEWSVETFTDEQAAWLQAQLADIPEDEWKIVIGHGFYYGSGLEIDGWNWYDNPETIERLTPLFCEYGVDIVFSGHLHRPELLQESGIVYVNCGAFGGLPDPEPSYVSPYSLWDGTGEYAFADITIEDDEGTLVFRDPGFEALQTYTFSRE